MPTSTWTRLVVALAAAIALIIVWATSRKLDITYARAVLTATSAVTLLLLAFDRWLWRFPPFRWAIGRPVLQGTWKIAQRTSYKPRSEQTMEAYLVIHQTYSTIRVNGLYAISDSESQRRAHDAPQRQPAVTRCRGPEGRTKASTAS